MKKVVWKLKVCHYYMYTKKSCSNFITRVKNSLRARFSCQRLNCFLLFRLNTFVDNYLTTIFLYSATGTPVRGSNEPESKQREDDSDYVRDIQRSSHVRCH